MNPSVRPVTLNNSSDPTAFSHSRRSPGSGRAAGGWAPGLGGLTSGGLAPGLGGLTSGGLASGLGGLTSGDLTSGGFAPASARASGRSAQRMATSSTANPATRAANANVPASSNQAAPGRDLRPPPALAGSSSPFPTVERRGETRLERRVCLPALPSSGTAGLRSVGAAATPTVGGRPA